MTPLLSIAGKDTITQQRIEILMSSAQTEIMELGRENSLYIFRLNRRQQPPRQESQTESISVDSELIGEIINPALFAHGIGKAQEPRNTQETRGTLRRRLAAKGSGVLVVMIQLGDVAHDEEAGGQRRNQQHRRTDHD